MAAIRIFVGAMVTILDGWPCPLPSQLPLQPWSPPSSSPSSSPYSPAEIRKVNDSG